MYLEKLISSGDIVDLKKVAKKRTVRQNSYLHKLFTLWGSEIGYTTEEAKQVIKAQLGYTYEKNGQTFYSHTSGMDTKELTTFIDRFRNLASSQGVYLPSSDEYGLNYAYFEQQVEAAIAMERRYGL